MKDLKDCLMKSACGLLVLGLVACSHTSGSENTDARTVFVKTMEIVNTSTIYQREYIGTVESDNSVDLSFQVNGNIEQMYAKEGQSVAKGQLLARLNKATLESSYRSAKASLDQAQDAYDRLSRLYSNNSLPEIKYIEAKSALEQAASNERIALKNLNDCNLYAPFAGVIGKRVQEEGANVMPGTPVFNLMSISTVKVRVAIPENDISAVVIGDDCQIKITALGNRSFEGKVIEKGVVAHPVSHTYDIKIQLNNSQNEIMPGMVCKSYLLNKGLQGGIIVPLKAVQVDSSGKRFVWLVEETGKASYREVHIGELIGNGVLIENGLTDGEQLVVEGYQNLSPGAAVKEI